MDEADVTNMILDIMSAYDYDAYKSLVPDLAEEPEFAEQQLEELKEIAIAHLNKLS